MEAPNKSTKHKEDLFSKWDEKSAYLLGYLEADGCFKIDKQTIRIYFQTSEKDKTFLIQLKELTEFTGTLGSSSNFIQNKEYKKIRFTVSSRAWKKDLERIGYRNNKIPNIPEDLVHHYVRGYFDGDGSIFWDTKHKHDRSNFVFSSQEFAEEIVKLLRPITRSKLTIYRKTSSDKCWYINLGNKATERLMIYMYKDATIYLERKLTKASKYLKIGENLVTLDKSKDKAIKS